METSVINNTDECATNETYGFEEIVNPIVLGGFGLIGVTGFVGNILVILVVLLNTQMRSTTNILILNLSTADLLFVVFCIPFTAADYLLRVWPFGQLWCKTVQYLIVVTVHTSIYTLVLMSLDRFLAVVYPIASRSIRTESYTFKTIIILWIIAVVTAIPVPFIYELSVISLWFHITHLLIHYWYAFYGTHPFRILFGAVNNNKQNLSHKMVQSS